MQLHPVRVRCKGAAHSLECAPCTCTLHLGPVRPRGALPPDQTRTKYYRITDKGTPSRAPRRRRSRFAQPWIACQVGGGCAVGRHHRHRRPLSRDGVAPTSRWASGRRVR